MQHVLSILPARMAKNPVRKTHVGREIPARALRHWLPLVMALLSPPSLLGQTDSLAVAGQRRSVPVDTVAPPGVDCTRLAIVGGVTAVGVTAIHVYQQHAWWRGYRGKFHFEEDLVYAKNVDKLGHLYAASVLSFVFSRSLQWADVPDRSALIWGAVGSTLFETYVEVEDGFSKFWGFDRVDFASDVVGAWYPVAQEFLPALRSFNFKFSYLPKNQGEPRAFPGQTRTIFDDYEGQTIWLSVSVHDLLPRPVDACWPQWLCLAAGVAVKDNSSPDRYLVFYLAPDLDLTKIIPSNTWFLKTLGQALNFIHLPTPAVRFAPNVVWYGLYF